MRIKKHKNRNDYLLSSSGVWVRDFDRDNVIFQDINQLTSQSDHARLLENEVKNKKLNLPGIDSEEFSFPKVLIVSDGYKFKERHRILSNLPDDVTVFAVNGALSKWDLVGPNCPTSEKRTIDFYVINNPYEQCMRSLPRRTRYYPRCLASVWTNPEFLSIYDSKSTVYQYTPSPPEGFTTVHSSSIYCLDDYRNPICAAISFAYRCGVDKLGFLCCDDSFSDERPGADILSNGLYCYPQQRMVHGIIDANLYWLRQCEDREVSIVDCSSGMKYVNATYIEPDKLVAFYEGQDD